MGEHLSRPFRAGGEIGGSYYTQAVGLGFVISPLWGSSQRDPNRYPSPEGAEQSSSIPHVPLVVGNSVRVQQLPEFLLKADHAVVGFLLCYVEWEKRLRHGKRVSRPFRAGGKIGG